MTKINAKVTIFGALLKKYHYNMKILNVYEKYEYKQFFTLL